VQENNTQIIIYQNKSGETRLSIRINDEIIWLTQKMMVKVFLASSPKINMHLKNTLMANK